MAFGLETLGSIFSGIGDAASGAYDYLGSLFDTAPSYLGGTSGIGPFSNPDLYANTLSGIAQPLSGAVTGAAANSPSWLESLGTAAIGPAFLAYSSGQAGEQAAEQAALDRAEAIRQFNERLALQKEQGGGGSGNAAAMAAVELNKRIAKANLQKAAFESQIAASQQGRQAEATALERLVQNLQAPLLRR